MKRFLITAIAVAVVGCTTVPSGAQGLATVMCFGLESTGPGPRLYTYDVSSLTGQAFSLFYVGTDDGNFNNYANWLMPAGWGAAVLPSSAIQHWLEKTPHGGLSMGPAGSCPFMVAWTGPPIAAGMFGYDNPNRSHDVGWLVGTVPVTIENWAMPVGMGYGPVHGPVPEPGSLLTLAAGALSLLGLIRKK